MKAHKKKEPSHEYCHRCDVDCEDDSDLLIHMIESGRHSKHSFPLHVLRRFADSHELYVQCVDSSSKATLVLRVIFPRQATGPQFMG
jgi:hypothetical protein